MLNLFGGKKEEMSQENECFIFLSCIISFVARQKALPFAGYARRIFNSPSLVGLKPSLICCLRQRPVEGRVYAAGGSQTTFANRNPGPAQAEAGAKM